MPVHKLLYSRLDIIVPVRNEAGNVREFVRRLLLSVKEISETPSFIFVVDPSTDDTSTVLKQLARQYPIKVFKKKGRPGKAISILEGADYGKAPLVLMIDGDLQYPPEVIPEMIELSRSHGVVIAKRKGAFKSRLRAFSSKLGHLLVGKIILGLPYDVQSGLKLFRREILDHIDRRSVGPWSLDAEIVGTAINLGYSVGSVDIDFAQRKSGRSNVHLLSTTADIIRGALSVRSRRGQLYRLKPTAEGSMLGAGIAHQRKRFITHTTLHHSLSAVHVLVGWQKVFLLLMFTAIALGFFISPLSTAVALVAILSTLYFLDVLFSLFVILKSLHFPPEINIPDEKIKELKDLDLPVYSILCPLYREANVLPQFIKGMEALDWPKDKLEVLLLLEENDQPTIQAAENLNLPDYFKIVLVPDSQPKTKPKACNYGLGIAKGEYVVIYDAEDLPDPLQLKKSYLAFKQSDPKVICLQAKLNYYNPHHNLLTRLFTAEYSLWFDVVLPGLQSIETTIPLGGTSNHFRRKDLLLLEGWDPFNVTEDCDLGVRLFKAGYKTAIIDSTTLEEANSQLKNWLRQRSRWIKGYIQTYLVHMRHPVRFVRTNGWHAFIFQMVVGGKTAFMFINPLLWLMTISYFVLYSRFGPTIESLYPAAVFYIAAFSFVIGNFIYLYDYMIGCAKRGHWTLIKYVYLVPFYWLTVSVAAGLAAIQLVVKPHFWEKTVHGFHLEKEEKVILDSQAAPEVRGRRLARLIDRITGRFSPEFTSGGLLVFASLTASFFNFLYNAYLSRAVSVEDFGLVSLVGSFVYLSQVPISALGRTFTHHSAFFFGKYGTLVKKYWQKIRANAFKIAFIVAVFWVFSLPFLRQFFRSDTILPFVLFTPVWVIASLQSIDQGYLASGLRFQWLAILAVSEAVSKFLISVLVVSLGYEEWVYLAVPASMALSFFIGYLMATNQSVRTVAEIPNELGRFSKKFFATSTMMKLSSIAFLSVDLILAKHFLTPDEAGQYSYLSLVGKMVYFIGSLFTQFILPIVSKEQGAGKDSRRVFNKLLGLVTLASLAAFVVLGSFGSVTVPFLWGPKTKAILPLLTVYCAGMVFYQIAATIVSYHQIHRRNVFPFVFLVLTSLQIVGIITLHDSVATIAEVVAVSGLISLGLILVLDIFYWPLRLVARNLLDLLGLFLPMETKPAVLPMPKKERILIFNWRDVKHVWSGGAEVYIQELAKRWVKMGHTVTVFCGNDGRHPKFETIDGVYIIRRGGFYTVYAWAFLYYIFRLHWKFDVILDCENGVPFFTPLYSSKKIFLVIHHVHQEVFRRRLKPPFSWLAIFLESRLMPLVYRRTRVITVSPSSKADILGYQLTGKDPEVIYNGVDREIYKPGVKNKTPLIVYLGRLKFYKSLDVFLMAARKLIDQKIKAEFVIAGDGEERKNLETFAKQLGLEDNVKFLGRVSEEEKVSLLQRAWVFVNPSLIEGWGISTIEANACGTPVIASNVAGLRDAVWNPHSGFLVPYGDVSEFAKKVKLVISDRQLREKMSSESIEWASKFDWDKSASQAVSMIND